MSPSPSETCVICRRPLGGGPPAAPTCGDPACRLAHARHLMRRVEVERASPSEAEVSREEFRRRLRVVQEQWERERSVGGPEGGGAAVTALPLFRVPLSPLPEARRRELEQHLVSLLARVRDGGVPRPVDAPEPPPGHEVASPPAPVKGAEAGGKRADWRDPPFIGEAGEALSVRICAACRGHCCQQGGTHAFLDRERLAEVLARSPELSPSDLVEAYLGFLPDRTFEGSCVFHGEKGCGLPRDMRGYACNRHFCWGARRIRDAVAEGEVPRAFVGFFGPDGMASTVLLD